MRGCQTSYQIGCLVTIDIQRGDRAHLCFARRLLTSTSRPVMREVADFLKSRGFSIVTLTGMTVVEQAKLVRARRDRHLGTRRRFDKYLVSAVRARNSCLELFPSHGWTSLCFFKLAEISRLRYYYMIAEDPSDPTPS